MSCIEISLNKSEINDIVSSLTVACGQSNYFNGTKKMFIDKCIEQDVMFDTQQTDNYYYVGDVKVQSMPIYQYDNIEDKYVIVQKDGRYFIVGSSQLTICCETLEEAEKQCRILNED